MSPDSVVFRLWAQVQLEQEAPGRSLSLSASRFPPQGPSITISASYLLPTVSSQFHAQATHAVLIPPFICLGTLASGHLTSTVHSSYNCPYGRALEPDPVGLMELGEPGSKGEALPSQRLGFPAGTQQQGEITLQRPERWVACQSRWPGGRTRMSLHIGLPGAIPYLEESLPTYSTL